MNRRKSQNSPPTFERIAELKAGAERQLALGLSELIIASKIEKPVSVASVLCQVLVQFIMANDSSEPTFANAGKIAERLLKTVIKEARYGLGLDGELIDVKTGKEISPGGWKQ